MRNSFLLAFLLALTTSSLVIAQPIVRKETSGMSRPPGETWVVSIGVGKYIHAPSLAYTITDAEVFAKAYEQVGLVPVERVCRVVDRHAETRNAAELNQILAQWTRKAKPNDTFVLYFSGHGFTAQDGTAYLAPSDFDPSRAAETGISMDGLRKQLDECPAQAKFVILDACYSGGFRTGSQLDGQFAVDLLKQARGTVAICSCTSGQQSLESSALKHGVFTYWLTRGLRGEANSQIDSIIDAAELFRFVKDRVVEMTTNEFQHVQQPTWGFDQMADIPSLIELRRPDKPSVLVPMKQLPMGNDPRTLGAIMDSLEHFPNADARNAIGMCKWILANAPPGSDPGKRAQQHLDKIDAQLLAGTIRLSSADGSD
jgi:hypothetical protein